MGIIESFHRFTNRPSTHETSTTTELNARELELLPDGTLVTDTTGRVFTVENDDDPFDGYGSIGHDEHGNLVRHSDVTYPVTVIPARSSSPT